MTEGVECVVIGAGVVGLAIARELALQGREVVVLEAESSFGTQTSSRNSEVIHAGIYYPGQSLKALSCVRGRKLLYEYCRARSIEHRRTGKLIVATYPAEIETLVSYQGLGLSNGVDQLELLSMSELQQLEPDVDGVAALWSPDTGIVDSHGLMLSLLGELEDAGGTLVTRSPVSRFRQSTGGFELDVTSDGDPMLLSTRLLINAAGHGALSLAGPFLKGQPTDHYYVAGHYFSYPGSAPFRHLVYPVPNSGSLGVHATLDLAGQIRFGPGVEWRDKLDYSFGPVKERQTQFAKSIKRYYPGLDEKRLQAGYVGIRPRLSAPGEALPDFVISGPRDHQVDGLVQLLGIESPGLTACLAIAEIVAAKLSPSRHSV